MAILIFSFGILGLVGLQASSVDNSIGAEDRTRAALLADELIGTLWSRHKLLTSTCDPQCALGSYYTDWQNKVKAALLKGSGTMAPPFDPATNIFSVEIKWTSASKNNGTPGQHIYQTQVAVQ